MNNLLRHILIAIVSVLAIPSFCQDLKVKSFSMQMEPMTVAMQKKDLNGFICPLVKVQLPVNGVKYEGNIIDALFDVNEYWVYLAPNSKMMAVKCPGFKTIKIYFQDYDIPHLVSKKIYILDLELNTINSSTSFENAENTAEETSLNLKSGDEELWGVYFDANKKAGFQNVKGHVFIPAQFDDALCFSEGLAGVKLNDKWGFIDRYGNIIIQPTFNDVSAFKGGNAKAEIIVNESGKLSRKYCLIDYTGTQVTSAYDDIDFFHDERARIKIGDKYGYVSRNGEEIIPAKYEKAGWFSDGYAPVQHNDVWGVIDIGGNYVIQPIYEDILITDYQVVAAKNNDKWGYLDMNGKNLTKFMFDDVDDFEECDLAVVEKNERCGLINTKGKLLIPIKYDELDLIEIKNESKWYEPTTIVRAGKNDMYGIVNLENKTIVPLKYDYLDFVESEGLIRADYKGKSGYINAMGSVVIKFIYDSAEDFCNGIGLVKKNGKWGGINTKGETVIPFIYEDHNHAPYGNNNGLFTLKLNNKWGCVNTNGSVQIPFEYDQFGFFSKGRAIVKKGQNEFVINEDGAKISERHPTNRIWHP